MTTGSPVLRTDFTDDAAWRSICEQARRPSPEGFEANVEFIDGRSFANLTKAQLLAAVPDGYPHGFVIVVDARAISDAEQPLPDREPFRRSRLRDR